MINYNLNSSILSRSFFPLKKNLQYFIDHWFLRLALSASALLKKYIKPFRLVVVVLLFTTSNGRAQENITYALHANIIYRFTKYIDWPENERTGDFVIGIVGDTPLYNELSEFTANKTVGNRKIVVKKMSSSSDSYNCNILFISEDKSKSLKKICEQTNESPVLIVSEASGMALKGSCINFVVVNDHLKLEINKSNILERKLNIANELLSLGVVVK